MSKYRSLALVAVVAMVGFSSPVLAQDRATVSSAELDVAAASSPASGAEAMRALLSSERVQKVAGQLGMNAADLAEHVAALDAAALNDLARRSGLDDQDLAGGANNIVISTTAVIIILLILILLTD